MPPFGVHGGETGAPVDSYVINADETEHHFASPGKVGGHPLTEGDTVILQSAAGGGYGDPLRRDPEEVHRDVENDLVSREIAETIYGVRFDNDGTIDIEGTASHRAAYSAARPRLRTISDENDPYVASGPSRRRTIRLHPADLAAHDLAPDQKIELLDEVGAPLRGWVVSTIPSCRVRRHWTSSAFDCSASKPVQRFTFGRSIRRSSSTGLHLLLENRRELNRDISRDRHPPHFAPLAMIIIQGKVLRGAIVPDRKRADRPAMAAGKFGPLIVFVKELEDGFAFCLRPPLETHCVQGVNIKCFAPCFRVGPHHGMNSLQVLVAVDQFYALIIVSGGATTVLPCRRAVHRLQGRQQSLHPDKAS